MIEYFLVQLYNYLDNKWQIHLTTLSDEEEEQE